MLTDIFAHRYRDVPLWKAFDENARRLLVQGFRIVSEQLFSYNNTGEVADGAKEIWHLLNKQLAMELGLMDIAPSASGFYDRNNRWIGRTHTDEDICENFVCAKYDGSVPEDQFIKERLSFIELAFQHKEHEISEANAGLSAKVQQKKLSVIAPRTGPSRGGFRVGPSLGKEEMMENIANELRAQNETLNSSFQSSCAELNERFRNAKAKLDYHNGFIQLSTDEITRNQVDRPFWNLVSAPEWESVDHDMKEAIDLRDIGGRDPALHAAKALESTIKIISDDKGWTTGKENGAVMYINNLRNKKNSEFVNDWEGKILTQFFTSVRNPLVHGAGSDSMPKLSIPQTDWAIEFCMIWIKNLIRRM